MIPSRLAKYVFDKLRQSSGGLKIDSSWINVGTSGASGKFLSRFSHGDSTPKLLSLPITGLIHRVLIGIEIPFDTPSTLSIGTVGNPSLLMTIGQNLPAETGQFESSPNENLVNQQIILAIAPGLGISQGSGFVIVEYSVP